MARLTSSAHRSVYAQKSSTGFTISGVMCSMRLTPSPEPTQPFITSIMGLTIPAVGDRSLHVGDDVPLTGSRRFTDACCDQRDRQILSTRELLGRRLNAGNRDADAADVSSRPIHDFLLLPEFRCQRVAEVCRYCSDHCRIRLQAPTIGRRHHRMDRLGHEACVAFEINMRVDPIGRTGSRMTAEWSHCRVRSRAW